MIETKNFIAFEERVGTEIAEEALERIADSHWNDDATNGVRISDIHTINACNHVLTGDVDVGGETFAFIVESGDIHGTRIFQWCHPDDAESYEAPKPTRYMFVPEDDVLELRNPAQYQVYLVWREQAWFKEKLGAYHYDRHFAPGCKTEGYYRDWAKSKGMKIRAKGEGERMCGG